MADWDVDDGVEGVGRSGASHELHMNTQRLYN